MSAGWYMFLIFVSAVPIQAANMKPEIHHYAWAGPYSSRTECESNRSERNAISAHPIGYELGADCVYFPDYPSVLRDHRK